MTPVLSATALTKRFGDVTAVSDLSFDLDAGTVVGFLGPNGAGKTTTLRMLLGLARPTSGRALVFGRPFAELVRPAARVGAVLDSADLHPGRSGRDHLRVLAPLVQVRPSRIEEVLALVDLQRGAAERRVEGYSLGMRQRLCLAAALLGDPELLLLDEPANGLDPEGVRWLRDFLRALAGQGRTVLVSSHHLAEVAQTVDRVVIINRGRLVVESPLSGLTTRFGRTVRVEAARPDALETVLRTAGLAIERENGTLHVHGVSADRIGELALAAHIQLHQLADEPSSLEEVFLQLTTEAPS